MSEGLFTQWKEELRRRETALQELKSQRNTVPSLQEVLKFAKLFMGLNERQQKTMEGVVREINPNAHEEEGHRIHGSRLAREEIEAIMGIFLL